MKRKTSNRRLGQQGFTLVEILVVVLLIAMMLVVAVPSLSRVFRPTPQAVMRGMRGIVKNTYNATVISGNVHRIVYDLSEHAYWVEKGPPVVLLDSEASREKDEVRKKFAIGKKEEKKKSNFALATTVTRDKVSLPSGVRFIDIMTEQSPEKFVEGKAYTHFFPHGVTERTLVHLSGTGEQEVTFVIEPLTGITRIENDYIKMEDAFGKK